MAAVAAVLEVSGLLLVLAMLSAQVVAGVDAAGDGVAVGGSFVLTELALEIDHALPGEIEELRDFSGVSAEQVVSADRVAVLQKQLLELGRYSRVVCQTGDRGFGPLPRKRLTCRLSPAPVVRRFHFKGVPFWTILEADLKKRIFLRPGQRVDVDKQGRGGRIKRQQQRIARYLEREGVFGAKVKVRQEPVAGEPRFVDLLIEIDGGASVAVRRVEVLGLERMAREAETIAEKLRPPVWSTFSPLWLREQVEQLEHYLRHDCRYPEAQISTRYQVDLKQQEVDIVARVRAGPRLVVSFAGDAYASRQQLFEQLTFAKAGAVDQVEVDNSRHALRRWLQQRGYAAVKVVATRREVSADRVDVRFDLTLGELAEIADVVVLGPPGFKTKKLWDKVDQVTETRQPQGMGGLVSFAINLIPPPIQRWAEFDAIGRLVDESIETERRQLEVALVNRGYPEGSVTSQVRRLSGGGLQVVYRVQPGERFRLKKIVCSGNRFVTCKEIRKVLLHRAGGPFLLNAFDVDRGRVLALYAQNGYPYATAAVLTDFDDGGRPVLRIKIEEGERVVLRSLIVEGQLDTRRAVIERELGVVLGAPLDPLAVNDGIRRLRRTGVLSRASASYVGLEEQQKELALKVDLEERNSFTLDTSVNFATSDLFGVEAELHERNMLGSMVNAVVDGRYSLFIGRHTYLRGSLSWPRIWATRLTLSLSSGYDLAERPTSPMSFVENMSALAKPAVDYVAGDEVSSESVLLETTDFKRTQAFTNRLSLDYAVTEAIRLALLYEFALDWENYGESAINNPFTFKEDEMVKTGAVATRVYYRRVDNPFDPRRGVQLNLGGKLGSNYLFGDGNFFLVSGGVQAYHSISRVTLAASFRSSFGFLLDEGAGQHEKDMVPDRDLMIAGGDRTLRGHKDNSIGVKERRSGWCKNPETGQWSNGLMYENCCTCNGPNCACKPQIDINPGLVGMVANVEMRTRLFRVWFGELQWALFADAAYVSDVWPNVENFADASLAAVENRHLGIGVGTGLRYVTPVGPIILDVAVDPAGLITTTQDVYPRPHIFFGYSF